MKRYTDKEMLDWLLFKNRFKRHHVETEILATYYNGEFKTPRQAVSAAMRGENVSGHQTGAR